MKVNKENNRRVMLLGIANTILILVITLLHINNNEPGTISYFVLHACTEITYILLLVYLINILQYANEKISVQTPFNIYLGLAFIKLLLGFLYTSNAGELAMGIGMLSMCLTIYLIISSFKIANEKIATAYKLFSLVLLLNMLTKIAIPFIVVISARMFPSRYFYLMDIMEVGTILYIIRSCGDLLKTNEVNVVNPDI